MNLNSIPPLTFLLAVTFSASAAADDQVRTTAGVVEGLAGPNGMRVFKGIPFAEPPVGDLRWKPPQPVKPWEGVKPTQTFGPSPMQEARKVRLMGIPANFSEDCLYLNVWAPARNGEERLPVMVWIYGGPLSTGSTAIPLYDGTHLAEKGVVVVSVAYRVGPFGFLAHPELTREGGKGNFGLLDQIAGLTWVRDNIAAFGGDPARVTIFGESSGGISVSMLAVSPRAKGLFQRAISQSGGSFTPSRLVREDGRNAPPLRIAEAEGEKFLASLGVKDIAAARALPAQAITKGGTWWPILDGDVLPADRYELYKTGQFNEMSVLFGTNSHEGALFVWPGVTTAGFVSQVHRGFGLLAYDILEAHPHTTPTEAFKASQDIFRDSAFAWQTWAWAKPRAEKIQGKAFVYFFDHRAPPSPGGLKPGDEIGYVFRNLGPFGPPSRPKDTAVSDLMSAYWVNFAKTGDPNGTGLPEWPTFTAASPQVMFFGADPGVKPVPNLDQVEALDAYYTRRRERTNKQP